LVLILLPSVFLLYDGDTEEVFAKVQPQQAIQFDENAPLAQNISLNILAEQIKEAYPDHHIQRAQLRNYGREDAVVTWQIDDEKGINAPGTLSMKMRDGIIMEEYSVLPYNKAYSNAVTDYIFKLHFATFGGTPVKILYFILSMITCFMVISGVLIWRTARDNKRYTLKQRLFHHRVTKWYLAICLSLFPAFAILFLANKVVPIDMDGRTSIVNTIFFLSWLALTIMGIFWNKYAQQNRNYLIIGGFLALLVPLANGIVTGGWIWNMWSTYSWVAYIDLFWIGAGLTALYLSFFVLKVKPESDQPVSLAKEQKVVEEVAVQEVVLRFKAS